MEIHLPYIRKLYFSTPDYESYSLAPETLALSPVSKKIPNTLGRRAGLNSVIANPDS